MDPIKTNTTYNNKNVGCIWLYGLEILTSHIYIIDFIVSDTSSFFPHLKLFKIYFSATTSFSI